MTDGEGSATWPEVSVIVPVYNARHMLKILLDALQQQDFPRQLTEVILVDDASTDDTAAFVELNYPEVTLLRSHANRGSYAARNRGLARARGKILAFTDADCRPSPGWLSAGVEALRQGAADVIAGAVIAQRRRETSAVEYFDQMFGINQRFYVDFEGFGATANLFTRRDIVDRVGGFDDLLRSGGDQKFCKEATVRGATLAYEEHAIVTHKTRVTFAENYRKVTRIAKGLASIEPRWRYLRLAPLSRRHPQFFDHEAFMRTGTAWFRWRFRLVYYTLQICLLSAYASESLRASRRD